MKVLFFGDTPTRIGGAQKSLLAALENIRPCGIDPVVVFPTTGPFEEMVRSRGLRVELIEGTAAFKTFGKALLGLKPGELGRVMASELAPYWRRLIRFADAEKIEAFHFNTIRGAIMVGPAAHLGRRGCVLHQRGTTAQSRALWLAAEALVDRIVIVTRTILDMLDPSAKERARLVYNGIRQRAPIPREAARGALAPWLADQGVRLGPGEKVVASLSSPIPFKGLHHLVEAARRARDRGVNARYLLAGKGDEEYEAWLRGRVRELGLEGVVHFVGYVDRVHEFLCASDVMTLTSMVGRETVRYGDKVVELRGTEGLPRSNLESMAAGIPVIATDGGGVREQLEEGVTGLIIPPADVGALTNALVRACTDDRLASLARVRGPAVVQQRFSVEAAARGLADVLFEVRERPSFSSRARVMAELARDAFMRR